ncbi:hypothetical protein EVAR_66592_1 [Eumeta japonica]|uniref:Uncharacterized protein n=1 Tax=Eumeta variegata TaxID=151549 RepID=A0A4C1ZTJ7_EUMVA|nr:hypothetical protein EVAR_66592_1 [Eumeta japonica]
MIKCILVYYYNIYKNIKGYPAFDTDIASAAEKGDWDEVHRLLSEEFSLKHNLRPLSEAEIRELKPEKGGYVHAEAISTFKSSSNVGGKTMSQSGGHKIINDNGAVTEFNFMPY